MDKSGKIAQTMMTVRAPEDGGLLGVSNMQSDSSLSPPKNTIEILQRNKDSVIRSAEYSESLEPYENAMKTNPKWASRNSPQSMGMKAMNTGPFNSRE